MGAKKSKKGRKHGRWSRNGKGPRRLQRIGQTKARRAVARAKWLRSRRAKTSARLGLPLMLVTQALKHAYALKCRTLYGERV